MKRGTTEKIRASNARVIFTDLPPGVDVYVIEADKVKEYTPLVKARNYVNVFDPYKAAVVQFPLSGLTQEEIMAMDGKEIRVLVLEAPTAVPKEGEGV